MTSHLLIQLAQQDSGMGSLLLLLAAAIALCDSSPTFTTTPLDDYVKKPDSTYKYEDTGMKLKLDGYTAYYINMTSQTWLSGMVGYTLIAAAADYIAC